MKRDDNILPMQDRSGFSLVELLVYMAILAILMTLVVASFTQTQRRSVQQGDIAATQIQTGVGLGLLRSDLENAGFGLPWVFPFPPPVYNDAPDPTNVPNGVPAALNSQDAYNAPDSPFGADYLVIRGSNVIRAMNGQRWGYLGNDINQQVAVSSAGTGQEQLTAADLVIALRTGNSGDTAKFRNLVVDPAGAYTFRADAGGLAGIAPDPTPDDPNGEKLLLYGIADNAAPTNRPFNRTDYYIANNVDIPAHCAPGTGVLVKRDLTQRGLGEPQPLVDCVADFRVVYLLDNNNKGKINQVVNANGLAGLNAQQIREQVREVRCFILLHEGGRDTSYSQPQKIIDVGEVVMNNVQVLAGRPFDLANLPGIGNDWMYYRWKVVNIAVSPKNLR